MGGWGGVATVDTCGKWYDHMEERLKIGSLKICLNSGKKWEAAFGFLPRIRLEWLFPLPLSPFGPFVWDFLPLHPLLSFLLLPAHDRRFPPVVAEA